MNAPGTIRRILPPFLFLSVALSLTTSPELRAGGPFPSDDSAATDETGFIPLFNGRDLNGWVGATDGYGVEDGVLYAKSESGGNLYTAKEYGDFVLRFEFRLTPGANNGLGIRAPLTGNAAYEGMELQILDNSADRYKNLKPYQYHGSVYGVVSAKRGHLRPVGEWNEQEVTCVGRQIRVVLNGATIVDADLDEVSEGGTLDGQPHPGLERATGHIGLLGHGSRVEFRALRIKPLDRRTSP